MSSNLKLKILAIMSIILLCIGTTIKSLQNDTFYIIKLGNDILTNGIELKDSYCWITNLDYSYPHWLYDVFIATIYNNFNYFGVYVSTIILFIILILTIYIIQLKINKNHFLALFISIISIASLYGFATARSQLMTVILYLLQIYFIEKIINTGHKKYIIFLSLISLIIANIHATIWMFTFILYLPYIVSHCIYKIFNKKCKNNKLIIEPTKNIKFIIISFIISFIMGIFSPSRICYTYIFKVMFGISQLYIAEHAPLIVIENPYFIVISLILLIILIFSNTKIYLKELLMICGLTLMSLSSFRHLIFFYTIGLLYISIISIRYLNNKKDKTLDILGNILVNKKIIYFSTIIIIILASSYKFNINFKQEYVPSKEYPKEAIKFIKEELNIDDMKLYNGYNYGSYLLFNDIKVFIDSRCDLYLPEFNGLDYNIFEDAIKIEEEYDQKFKFYNISHALIKKDAILYRFLIKDNNYNIIYKDKYFALFERKNYEETKKEYN